MKAAKPGDYTSHWADLPPIQQGIVMLIGACLLLGNVAVEVIHALHGSHGDAGVALLLMRSASIFGGLLCLIPERFLMALERVPLPASWHRVLKHEGKK